MLCSTSSRWRPRALPLSTSDPLVAAERERVLVGDTSQDVLVLKNLTKKYTSTQRFRHHLAVNQLSFGVHKKEVRHGRTFGGGWGGGV